MAGFGAASKLDELISRLAAQTKSRTHWVSHESSNLDSVLRGFEERPNGISFARLPHERMSSPLASEPSGRRGIVYALVDGSGIDYGDQVIRDLVDQALSRSVEDAGSSESFIPAMRQAGVQWVNNWNSIGAADELHVLDPRAVKIRRVFELPIDRSYRFPSPQIQPPARAFGIDDYSQPIVPVHR